MSQRKHRSVRVEDDLWDEAQEACRYRGDNLSTVIRKHLVAYVRATAKKRATEEKGGGRVGADQK